MPQAVDGNKYRRRTQATGRGPAWLIIPVFLLGLALSAACATTGDGGGGGPLPKRVQRIVFKVLDARDRPVAGATVKLTAVSGRPVKHDSITTGPDGEAVVRWRPQVTDETAGIRTSDRVYRLDIALRWLVEAPGHLPVAGEIKRRDRDQTMGTAELQRLNRRAALTPIVETVVLRRSVDLLGRRLARLGPANPVYVKCLAFHRDNQPLVARLGAEFARPSFLFRRGVLTIRLDWRGASWEGMSQAPLLARVAFSAGVPLAMVCGEELLPLAGVGRLRLVFVSKVTSKDDPHALPKITRVVIDGQAADYRALASGRMSPDAFLAKNPPRRIKGGN